MLWDSFRDQLQLAVMEHPGEHPEDLDLLREEVAKGNLMVVQIFDGLEAVAVALLEFVKLRDGSSLHVRGCSQARPRRFTDAGKGPPASSGLVRSSSPT